MSCFSASHSTRALNKDRHGVWGEVSRRVGHMTPEAFPLPLKKSLVTTTSAARRMREPVRGLGGLAPYDLL